MSPKKNQEVGIIGLGVMGRNLAINFLDHGVRVAGWDKDPLLAEQATAFEPRIEADADLEKTVRSLNRPRRIIMLIQSGPPVDDCLKSLVPMLDKGDIVIDGGNSHYRDTIRREGELSEQEVLFLGLGLSGGTAGARQGPSIMAGGKTEAWDLMARDLNAIAAVADGTPCCGLLGPAGAGHFVKMVHNGIEYALMQAIAEAYHVLRDRGGWTPGQIGDAFSDWSDGPAGGYGTGRC